jgi:bifunctional oligoribonuclease and PAP phosphatase NrnA
MEKVRKQIIDLIKRSKSILIMPSSPVDGDSLGSALALYLILKKVGRQATVVCADPIPEAFRFLPTTKVISNEFISARDFIVTLDCKKAKLKSIRTALEHDKVNIILTAKKGQFSGEDVSFHHGPSRYDLIITVDTGDLEQLGRFYEDNTELFTKIPVINIDHHASNNFFGKVNLVDVMGSATTEVLLPLVHDFESEFDKKLMDEDIATLLLAGIITDTGSFQNANTTPRSFAASAELIRCGAHQQEIIQHVFKTKHLSTLRLWGRILTNLRLDKKHRFVWSTISSRDLLETGSREDETGGIIDELLTNAPGTEVVLLLKERSDGIISGSVRTTTPSADASRIAEIFGGGGHTRAAGFKIPAGDFAEVEKMVTEKIREYQKKRLNLTEEDESAGRQTDAPHNAVEGVRKTAVRKAEETESETPVSKKEKSVTLRAPAQPPDEEETFTEMIIKKGPLTDESTEEMEMEPGITYKFEE